MSMNLRITPGTCGMAYWCAETFGASNIAPGVWGDPVTVLDVAEDEIDAFIDLVQEGEEDEAQAKFQFEKF